MIGGEGMYGIIYCNDHVLRLRSCRRVVLMWRMLGIHHAVER